MTVHVPEPKTIDSAALAQIFLDARTHNGFLDKSVSDDLLKKAVDIAKMGPTSANQSPLRLLFLKSKAAKERLRPALEVQPELASLNEEEREMRVAAVDVLFQFEAFDYYLRDRCFSEEFTSRLLQVALSDLLQGATGKGAP